MCWAVGLSWKEISGEHTCSLPVVPRNWLECTLGLYLQSPDQFLPKFRHERFQRKCDFLLERRAQSERGLFW